MRYGFLMWVALSLAICASAESINIGLKCFDPTPIDELYRVMLGRNSRPKESYHFVQLLVEGEQIAYFEPYLASDCGKYPNNPDCQKLQPVTCFSWVDYLTDPTRVGPAFYVGKEFVGLPSYTISTLYRTIFGRLPHLGEKRKWINKLKKGQSPSDIAKEMRLSQPVNTGYSWAVIDDIFIRILGRRADRNSCIGSSQPSPGTDCWWLNELSNGRSVLDLIHSVRSSEEAMTLNESQFCVEQFPNQGDPHALGEYIRQTYRVLLRRNPRRSEMVVWLNQYAVGRLEIYLVSWRKKSYSRQSTDKFALQPDIFRNGPFRKRERWEY